MKKTIKINTFVDRHLRREFEKNNDISLNCFLTDIEVEIEKTDFNYNLFQKFEVIKRILKVKGFDESEVDTASKDLQKMVEKTKSSILEEYIRNNDIREQIKTDCSSVGKEKDELETLTKLDENNLLYEKKYVERD